MDAVVAASTLPISSASPCPTAVVAARHAACPGACATASPVLLFFAVRPADSAPVAARGCPRALTVHCCAVIIIGVGGADFKNMELLDADTQPLRSRRGEGAKRDIVQFVPFREFSRRGPEALAAEVLVEIPPQIVGCTFLSQTPGAPAHALRPRADMKSQNLAPGAVKGRS